MSLVPSSFITKLQPLKMSTYTVVHGLQRNRAQDLQAFPRVSQRNWTKCVKLDTQHFQLLVTTSKALNPSSFLPPPPPARARAREKVLVDSFASNYKCLASSNKCLTSSNKKLLILIKFLLLLLVRHLLLVASSYY